MTNEEWLNGLDIERKAIFMVRIQMASMDIVKRGMVDSELFIKETVDWLNAEHKE